MSRWQAVVFDLDDTLYPERDYVRGGLRAAAEWAAASLGVESEPAFDGLWSLFEQGVRGDIFDRWLRARGVRLEVNREAMVEAYRGHRPSLAPYPDVLPTLARLGAEARLGLITEGWRSVQASKVAALGLDQALPRQVILGEDEPEHWKPSPEPFRRWLEGQPIAAGQAIYVGDNPAKDFLGARRAGWTSVRLRRADGLHRGEEPATTEAAPDFEIDSLEALLPLLGIVAA